MPRKTLLRSEGASMYFNILLAISVEIISMFNINSILRISPEKQFDENFRIFRCNLSELPKNIYAELLDLLQKTYLKLIKIVWHTSPITFWTVLFIYKFSYFTRKSFPPRCFANCVRERNKSIRYVSLI